MGAKELPCALNTVKWLVQTPVRSPVPCAVQVLEVHLRIKLKAMMRGLTHAIPHPHIYFQELYSASRTH